MIDSIVADFKRSMRSGNMVTRLILINVVVFLCLYLLKAVLRGFEFDFNDVLSWLALPNEGLKLLTRPWTIITHMFVHIGFWHVAVNMLYLYWFGRIVGDLIGDRHILPVYIYGGLVGALAYIIVSNIVHLAGGTFIGIGSMAYGASAAVAALVVLSGMIAPDYQLNLFLIGRVPLKYVVAFIVFFYIVGIFGTNSGGNIGHLGGVLLGYLYYRNMQIGKDWSIGFNNFLSRIGILKSSVPAQRHSPKKSPLKVSYKKDMTSKSEMSVDEILEKINKVGLKGLTQKEREFLDKASKK